MKSSKVETPAYKLMKKIEKDVRERVCYINDDYVVKGVMNSESTGRINVYSKENRITHVAVETVVKIAQYYMETVGFGNVYYGIGTYDGKGCIEIDIMKSKNEK